MSPVDINHAGMEELESVPGLGSYLAARVMDARPFESLEDLARVKGIGPSMVERMRPYLTLIPVEAPQEESVPAVRPKAPAASPAPEAQGEAVLNGALVEAPVATPVVQEARPMNKLLLAFSQPSSQAGGGASAPQPQTPAPHGMERSEAFTWGAGAMILTVFLAMLLSLGVLLAVNGSLSFVPSGEYDALLRRADSLSLQVDTLKQDNASLRARLDAMDSMGGRVSAMEKETQALRGDLDAGIRQLNALEPELDKMRQQALQLEERSKEYERFLDGLRALLGLPVTAQ